MVNLRLSASLSLAMVMFVSPGDDAETGGKTVQNHGDLTTNQLV